MSDKEIGAIAVVAVIALLGLYVALVRWIEKPPIDGGEQ